MRPLPRTKRLSGSVVLAVALGCLVPAPRLDLGSGLLAAVAGGGGQVGHALLVAALTFGRLGFQLSLSLAQPIQPPGGIGQFGWELVACGSALLAVFGLIGLGGLAQDLGG